MTRQHFKVLADEISRIEDRTARIAAARAVARACAYFNNAFDRTRFFKACGLEDV
jgi:hypothetical protein